MAVLPKSSVVWDPKSVALRLEAAIEVGSRLSRSGPAAFFNSWPLIIREHWVGYRSEASRRMEPTEDEVCEMLETMRWLTLLDEPERHVVLLTLLKTPKRKVEEKLGIHRTTIYRQYQKALGKLVRYLNAGVIQHKVQLSSISIHKVSANRHECA